MRKQIVAIVAASVALLGSPVLNAEDYTIVIGHSLGGVSVNWEIDPSNSATMDDMADVSGQIYCNGQGVASFYVSLNAWDYTGTFEASDASFSSCDFASSYNWGWATWDSGPEGDYTADVTTSLWKTDQGWGVTKSANGFQEHNSLWAQVNFDFSPN